MKYILSENQYKKLLEKKKTDKIIKILSENILKINNTLKTDILKESAIIDLFKKYKKYNILDNTILMEIQKNPLLKENYEKIKTII